MAFLPSDTFDCFLSYAFPDEGGWVKSLHGSLEKRLRVLLGIKEETSASRGIVFYAPRNVAPGDHLLDTIQVRLDQSSTLVAVLDPSYQGSDWCALELNRFLERRAGRGAARQAGPGFFKVVKIPWDQDKHLDFQSHYLHIDFYRRNNGIISEFGPESKAFKDAVNILANTVRDVLYERLRGFPQVFVASGSHEASRHRSILITEIKNRKLAVANHPYGEVATLSDELVKESIRQSKASVHVIDASSGHLERRYIDLAAPSQTSKVFVLLEDKVAEHPSKQLMEDIENRRWKHGGPWLVYQGADFGALLPDILEHVASAVEVRTTSLYLHFDHADPYSVRAAECIRSFVAAWAPGAIDIQQTPKPSSRTALSDHQRSLRECSALIVCGSDSNLQWQERALADLAAAKARRSGAPRLLASALVAAGPTAGTQLQSSILFERDSPFPEERLRQLLEPLIAPPPEEIHA